MRRGFKKEAREIAWEVRGDLGIGMTDPLDPWRLAEWLEIPVFGFSRVCGGGFSLLQRSGAVGLFGSHSFLWQQAGGCA